MYHRTCCRRSVAWPVAGCACFFIQTPHRGREPSWSVGVHLAAAPTGGDRVRRRDAHGLVEQPLPGCVAHVGAPLAGEREAQIILRRKHTIDVVAQFGLVAGKP